MAPGSSPRVRGKPRRAGGGFPPVRLIPACAGKTSCLSNWLISNATHPRVCGENFCGCSAPDADWGSSPRVRGKLRGSGCGRPRPGLIPACAGKTPRRPLRPRRSRAHPRVCGENAPSLDALTVNAGSSPRVRGKHPGLQSSDPVRRLIPARAGKTARASRSPPSPVAHPRVCGENAQARGGVTMLDGSSPRVRGKPETRSYPPSTPRLIPARAGKTARSDVRATSARAHPRACGENGKT